MTDTKIAVMFIHGVETSDPTYADRAMDLLRRSFTDRSGAHHDALVIQPVHWAPVLQEREDELFERCFGADQVRLVHRLGRWTARVNNGSETALLFLILSALLPRLLTLPATAPRLPILGRVPWPVLRWAATEFAGDAIAYQVAGERDHTVYDDIHACVASTLSDLAEKAGPSAPLCVIAHSLGSVIASNYFYDLQAEQGHHSLARKRSMVLVPAATRAARSSDHPTDLEQGKTLTDLITLGSPLALWSLRYTDFGRPLIVPSPDIGKRQAGLGTWINIYSPDDLVGYPLRGLSPEYAGQVREDIRLRVGPWWASWNPLSHVWYWNDTGIADLAATVLADTWQALHQQRTAPEQRRAAVARRPRRGAVAVG